MSDNHKQLIDKVTFGNNQGHYLMLVSHYFDKNTSLYEIHFNSEGIEFECNCCKANRSYICKCRDYNWTEGFITNDNIMASDKLDIIKHKYDLMKRHLNQIQHMSRVGLCNWLADNMEENERVYYDCDF